MPWRGSHDPYRIWVSEIMLQQTQVSTVIPYFEKWMDRFPTLDALAEAPDTEVMKYWAGLGYYRRAQMLHAAARHVREKLGGKIPDQVERLMELPGVGRYTAGAIASIAFGKKAPVLDGNVMRVLTRVDAVEDSIDRPATLRELWKLATKLVPSGEPGDFNQALMELGATICLPENPRCAKCPVHVHCAAHAQRRESEFPVRGKRPVTQEKTTVALVCRRDREVLIQRQPKEARWGGLWMFPFWDDAKTMHRETGITQRQMKPLLNVQHSFTRYRIHLEVFESFLPYRPPFPFESRWIRIPDLVQFAFPSPHQKIVKELLRHPGAQGSGMANASQNLSFRSRHASRN